MARVLAYAPVREYSDEEDRKAALNEAGVTFHDMWKASREMRDDYHIKVVHPRRRAITLYGPSDVLLARLEMEGATLREK